MIAADDLVVLEGRLSIREEESPKLLVEAVIPFGAMGAWRPRAHLPCAPRQAPIGSAPCPVPQKTDAQMGAGNADRKLYLRLPRAQLDAAAASVALHPGSVPVYLHIPQEKLTLLAPALLVRRARLSRPSLQPPRRRKRKADGVRTWGGRFSKRSASPGPPEE